MRFHLRKPRPKTEGIGTTKAAMATGKCFGIGDARGRVHRVRRHVFRVFLGATQQFLFAAQRMVGGICFCLGLVLVLCCGAELFTGNSLMCCAKASGKIDWAGMLKNWVIVWFGNLAGALVAVALIYFAQVYAMNGGAVGQAMVSVAAGKVSPDWFTLFAKGIMCNILVCLAVWDRLCRTHGDRQGYRHHPPDSAFVACGFEHCVANMFFLPTGLFAQLHGHRRRRRNYDGRHSVQPERCHARQYCRRRACRHGLLVHLREARSKLTFRA